MALRAATIFELYLAYLGRPPDAYATTFDQHLSAASLNPDHFFIFSASLEYSWLSATVLPTTPADIVQQTYVRLFDRSPEAAGLAYWVSLVASGALTVGDLPIAILQSAGGTDATSVQAKLAASRAFFDALDTPYEKSEFAGYPAAEAARDFLATFNSAGPVTTPEAERARLEAAVAAAVRLGHPRGETFQLSSQADAVNTVVPSSTQHTGFGVSTSGPDSFVDEYPMTAVPTRFDGDRLDGGGGTDTLSISVFDTSTAHAQIINVEVVNTAFNAPGDVLDLAGVRDLQSVVLFEGSPLGGWTPGSATLKGINSSVLVDAALWGPGPGLTIEYADRALPDQTVNIDLSGSRGSSISMKQGLALPDIEHVVIAASPRFNNTETTIGSVHAAQAQTVVINASAPIAVGTIDIAAGGKVVINSDSFVRTMNDNLSAGSDGRVELNGSAGMLARIADMSSFVSNSSGAVSLEVVSGDSTGALHIEQRGTGSLSVKEIYTQTLVTAVGGPQSDVFEQEALTSATFTGGGGADRYVFPEASQWMNLAGLLLHSASTITDFGRRPGEQGDQIEFVHPLTVTTNEQMRPGVARIDSSGIASFDPSDSTLERKVDAAYAGIRAGGGAGTNSLVLFADGADTYVFKGSSDPEFGYAGTDLVRLAGVALDSSHLGLVDGVLTAL